MFVASVPPHAIAIVQSPHRFAGVRFRRTDQKMIRHQYIRVDLHAIALRHFLYALEKLRPVAVVVVDPLPPLSTRGDVIPPIRYIDPQRSCQVRFVSILFLFVHS